MANPTPEETIPSAVEAPTVTPPRESRVVTRLLALLVIIIGLGIVGYVFLQAKLLFETPTAPLPMPTPTPKPALSSPGPTPAPDNALGNTALQAGWSLADFLIRRLIALLVMCLAGSLIAALGIRWWGKR